jgi:hypothetical protein
METVSMSYEELDRVSVIERMIEMRSTHRLRSIAVYVRERHPSALAGKFARLLVASELPGVRRRTSQPMEQLALV